MKVFKLKNDMYSADIHFGMPEIYQVHDCEKKLQRGLSKIKPWMYYIPYYNNSSIAFVSKDAVLTFLYDICNLVKEEIKILESIGYYIEINDVSLIDTGFSKIICAFRDDELNKEPENLKLSNLIRRQNYEKVNYITNIAENKTVKHIKNTYYKNIKTFF